MDYIKIMEIMKFEKGLEDNDEDFNRWVLTATVLEIDGGVQSR